MYVEGDDGYLYVLEDEDEYDDRQVHFEEGYESEGDAVAAQLQNDDASAVQAQGGGNAMDDIDDDHNENDVDDDDVRQAWTSGANKFSLSSSAADTFDYYDLPSNTAELLTGAHSSSYTFTSYGAIDDDSDDFITQTYKPGSPTRPIEFSQLRLGSSRSLLFRYGPYWRTVTTV